MASGPSSNPSSSSSSSSSSPSPTSSSCWARVHAGLVAGSLDVLKEQDDEAVWVAVEEVTAAAVADGHVAWRELGAEVLPQVLSRLFDCLEESSAAMMLYKQDLTVARRRLALLVRLGGVLASASGLSAEFLRGRLESCTWKADPCKRVVTLDAFAAMEVSAAPLRKRWFELTTEAHLDLVAEEEAGISSSPKKKKNVAWPFEDEVYASAWIKPRVLQSEEVTVLALTTQHGGGLSIAVDERGRVIARLVECADLPPSLCELRSAESAVVEGRWTHLALRLAGPQPSARRRRNHRRRSSTTDDEDSYTSSGFLIGSKLRTLFVGGAGAQRMKKASESELFGVESLLELWIDGELVECCSASAPQLKHRAAPLAVARVGEHFDGAVASALILRDAPNAGVLASIGALIKRHDRRGAMDADLNMLRTMTDTQPTSQPDPAENPPSPIHKSKSSRQLDEWMRHSSIIAFVVVADTGVGVSSEWSYVLKSGAMACVSEETAGSLRPLGGTAVLAPLFAQLCDSALLKAEVEARAVLRSVGPGCVGSRLGLLRTMLGCSPWGLVARELLTTGTLDIIESCLRSSCAEEDCDESGAVTSFLDAALACREPRLERRVLRIAFDAALWERRFKQPKLESYIVALAVWAASSERRKDAFTRSVGADRFIFSCDDDQDDDDDQEEAWRGGSLPLTLPPWGRKQIQGGALRSVLQVCRSSQLSTWKQQPGSFARDSLSFAVCSSDDALSAIAMRACTDCSSDHEQVAFLVEAATSMLNGQQQQPKGHERSSAGLDVSAVGRIVNARLFGASGRSRELLVEGSRLMRAVLGAEATRGELCAALIHEARSARKVDVNLVHELLVEEGGIIPASGVIACSRVVELMTADQLARALKRLLEFSNASLELDDDKKRNKSVENFEKSVFNLLDDRQMDLGTAAVAKLLLATSDHEGSLAFDFAGFAAHRHRDLGLLRALLEGDVNLALLGRSLPYLAAVLCDATLAMMGSFSDDDSSEEDKEESEGSEQEEERELSDIVEVVSEPCMVVEVGVFEDQQDEEAPPQLREKLREWDESRVALASRLCCLFDGASYSLPKEQAEALAKLGCLVVNLSDYGCLEAPERLLRLVTSLRRDYLPLPQMLPLNHKRNLVTLLSTHDALRRLLQKKKRKAAMEEEEEEEEEPALALRQAAVLREVLSESCSLAAAEGFPEAWLGLLNNVLDYNNPKSEDPEEWQLLNVGEDHRRRGGRARSESYIDVVVAPFDDHGRLSSHSNNFDDDDDAEEDDEEEEEEEVIIESSDVRLRRWLGRMTAPLETVLASSSPGLSTALMEARRSDEREDARLLDVTQMKLDHPVELEEAIIHANSSTPHHHHHHHKKLNHHRDNQQPHRYSGALASETLRSVRSDGRRRKQPKKALRKRASRAWRDVASCLRCEWSLWGEGTRTSRLLDHVDRLGRRSLFEPDYDPKDFSQCAYAARGSSPRGERRTFEEAVPQARFVQKEAEGGVEALRLDGLLVRSTGALEGSWVLSADRIRFISKRRLVLTVLLKAVERISARRYLLRPCALELHVADSTGTFLALRNVPDFLKLRWALRDLAQRGCLPLLGDAFVEKAAAPSDMSETDSPDNSKSHFLASLFDKGDAVTTPTGGQNHRRGYTSAGRLAQLTDSWQRRRLSNFAYLAALNDFGGRTVSDVAQWPVYPWVIADFHAEKLDDSSVYRDLSKPIGAHGPESRRDAFKERFKSFESADEEDIPKFMYGSHYSSAAIVLHFLVRAQPYASLAVELQGGRFDVPDRLFEDVADAWASATNSMTDVKELIPELFYCPEVLLNANCLPLGSKQKSGVLVHDVRLPPWAASSAFEFVRLHREALESEKVSNSLHLWVDLIFGKSQRGSSAIEASNVFYHLTYEGAVELDQIKNNDERKATSDQIMHFGQTPPQLFSDRHPGRLPLEECGAALFEDSTDFKTYVVDCEEAVVENPADVSKEAEPTEQQKKPNFFLESITIMSPSGKKQKKKKKTGAICDGSAISSAFVPWVLEAQLLDGCLVAVLSDKTLLTWRFSEEPNNKGWPCTLRLEGRRRLQPRSSFEHDAVLPRQPQTAAILRGGRVVSLGYADGRVRLHDTNGSLLGVSRGAHLHPGAACVASDVTGANRSSIFVTGGHDGLVCVWVACHAPLAEALGVVGGEQETQEEEGEEEEDTEEEDTTDDEEDAEEGGFLPPSRATAVVPGLTASLLVCSHVLFGHRSPITALAYSSCLDVVASGSTNGDICLHAARAGRFLRRLGSRDPAHLKVACLAIAEVSCELVAYSKGTLTLTTLSGYARATATDVASCTALKPTRDGTKLLCVGEAQLEIRVLHSLELLRSIPLTQPALSVALSPCDKYAIVPTAAASIVLCSNPKTKIAQLDAALATTFF